MKSDRIKIYFIFLCLSIVLFADIGFSQDIIAFGDSLTEGCGEPGVPYFACGWEGRTYTYPLSLQALFDNDHREITVKNFGKGGEQTWDGVNRLSEVLANSCELSVVSILLMEGTNDLFHNTDPSVVRFNLGIMIDKIREKKIQPILATITPDPDHPWKEISQTNELIRSLAAEKGVVLVDQYNELVTNWYWYTHHEGCYGDHLHPNALGFQAIATAWYKSMPRSNPPLPLLMLLRSKP